MEEVLVIPESHFRLVGYFEGFRPYDDEYLAKLLDPSQLSFRRRDLAETDPSFKQIIPYVVLKHHNQVFTYRRGKAGGEARLRSLHSIGIGGHINPVDAGGDIYDAGMRRELAEEVETAPVVSEAVIGFLYDPSNDVGKVHIGIVHVFELAEARATPREDKLRDGRFVELSGFEGIELESWSSLVLPSLSQSPD